MKKPIRRPKRAKNGCWTTEAIWAYMKALERYADELERKLKAKRVPTQEALF